MQPVFPTNTFDRTICKLIDTNLIVRITKTISIIAFILKPSCLLQLSLSIFVVALDGVVIATYTATNTAELFIVSVGNMIINQMLVILSYLLYNFSCAF